jgi:hypothetical protein
MIILLLVLKVDSEAMDEAGMASKSLTIRTRIGYLVALFIHHLKCQIP